MAQAQLAANPAFAPGWRQPMPPSPRCWAGRPPTDLAAGVTTEALAASDIAQPLLFAVQHGIVAALAAQGIRPAFCLGHSVGEVAAAAAAGMLDLATAARLVVARSRHQATTRGQGRMAALGAAPQAALPVLAALGTIDGRGIEIAAINAPESLTVAGPAALLAKLEAAAAEQRWSFLALDLDYAFHSAAMDGLRDGLLADLAGLAGQPSRVPLLSTVTGAVLDPAECGPAHWWRNLREPVQFQAAVQAAASLGPCLFLEIGPTAVLQGYLRDTLRAAGGGGGDPAQPVAPRPHRRPLPRHRRPRLDRRRRSARRPRLRRPRPAPRPAAYPLRPPAHLVRPNHRGRAWPSPRSRTTRCSASARAPSPASGRAISTPPWSPGWPTTAWPGSRCCRPPPCGRSRWPPASPATRMRRRSSCARR